MSVVAGQIIPLSIKPQRGVILRRDAATNMMHLQCILRKF